MKQPKITSGTWKSPSGNKFCVIAEQIDGTVEYVVEHCKLQDANAIKEVPNMITTLIEAHEELLHLYNILNIDGETTYIVKKIKNVLENSGCKQEEKI